MPPKPLSAKREEKKCDSKDCPSILEFVLSLSSFLNKDAALASVFLLPRAPHDSCKVPLPSESSKLQK
jgi:hypothetical protein